MATRSQLRITDRTIGTLEAPAKGARKYRDGAQRGYAVQVSYRGSRFHCLIYISPVTGSERLFTLGEWPAMSVDQGKAEARRLQVQVDSGTDPHEQRSAVQQAPTVADLVQRYEQDHLPRKAASSQRNDKALGEMLVDKLGKRKVADVRHADCDRLHREMTRAGIPIRANRFVALGSRMWNLALKWEWAENNPWRGIERNGENRRSRYLTPAELQRLGAVLDSHPEQQSANAIRLLLLTGARRGEVLGATWSMFDLERGIWTKPSAHTKQRKEHRIPLSAPALKILTDMQAAAGDSPFLFGTTPGKHMVEIKKFWAAVCGKAQISGARVHDLRHTHASILASAGLSLPIIGALLGHTQASTTHRYSHLMDDPLRAAAERVGAAVTGRRGEGAEVVELRTRNTA